jgi:twitching motility protein PilT
MARLDSFLRLVAEQQASDLHFHSGGVPLIRHDGDLIALPFRDLSDSETRRFLLEIMTPEQAEALRKDQQVDFIYALPDAGRFRASVFIQSRGIGAVLRVIPNRVPSLDELGFPPTLKRLLELKNGLVIVTGPTGAGKTTTLAAMIQEINDSQCRNIITLEDPIEYVHEPVKSNIIHREVGNHTDSFASGLRAALRESPDVLVLGEMRDLDTVQLALQAAETGTLVFATLHTNSAARAVDRILDAIPEENREQARGTLSLVLRAVIAQRLARLASGDGRVAVLEVLLQSWAVSNLIRESKVHLIEALLRSGGEPNGSQGFDTTLLQYVKEGRIAPEEGVRLSSQPEIFSKRVAELAVEAAG